MAIINKVILLAGLLCFTLNAYAQQSFRFSQFFQNAVTFNPAVSGSEDFVDLKVGYRQQWSGMSDAPQTYFISAHAPLEKKQKSYRFQNNSLRISNPNLYNELAQSRRPAAQNISHGLGGYIVNDIQGIFQQTTGFLTYALGYSIGNTVVSIGAGAGVVSRELDMNGVVVGDNEVTDNVYQAYLAQQGRITNFDVNAGIFVRNELFYVGYSANRLVQNEIFANVEEISATPQMEHYGMLGLRLNVNNNLMVIPGALVRYVSNEPLIYDLNLRMRYNDILWLGASYRNTQTVVAMAGITISNFINLGYSYDLGLADVNDFTSGVHEIGLGFMLFNQKDATPYLW